MEWPTFWVKETGEVEVRLRRWASPDTSECPGGWSYHNATARIGRAPEAFTVSMGKGDLADHPQWPTHCECGYEFAEDDNWQVNHERFYRATDGSEWPQDCLPIGASYDLVYEDFPCKPGPDGIYLVVVIPPGRQRSLIDHWHVDVRARNCNKPDLDHYCWVRTGDPRAGSVDVTKGEPGKSCDAGAGSIQSDAWHGYLRNGVLIDA